MLSCFRTVRKSLLCTRTMAGVGQGPVFDHVQGSDASPQCPTGGCAARSREEAALSVDSSSRDELAKMPSGEPISAAFLSSLLPSANTTGAGAGAAGAGSATGGGVVTSFRVDPTSVIEGRHSTTFRLLLNPPPSSARCLDPESRTNNDVDCCAERAVIHSSTRTAVVVPSSVFVKRIVCKELPARSRSKWR